MNKLDLFFLVVLGIGFIRGLMKGAIMQLASLAAIVLGIYGASTLYEAFAHFLAQSLHVSAQLSAPLAFLLLFVAIGLGLFFLGKLLSSFFKAISLSWIDRLLGALIGLLKVALILGILLQLFAFLDTTKSKGAPTKTHSTLYQTLEAFPSQVLPFFHLYVTKPSVLK